MKSYLKTVLATTLCYLIVLSVFPLSLFSAFAVEITLDGDGTQASPYLIKNAEEFVYAMGEYANDDEVYMSLENDIDVSDIYSPVNNFKANFKGNYNTITAPSRFANSNYGKISSLFYINQIDEVEYNEENSVRMGGLVNTNNGIISNIIVHANVSGTSAGIISLDNSGQIINCAAFGSVKAKSYYGSKAAGVSVTNSGTIANCYVSAGISASGSSRYGVSRSVPITFGNYENSYFDSTICKLDYSDGYSTAYMKSSDFIYLLNKDVIATDSLWTVDSENKNNGYPILKSAYNAAIKSSKSNIIISGTESVELSCDESEVVYYTLDGSEPDSNSTLYTGPIEISDSVTIKAIGYRNGLTGNSVRFDYVKINGDGTEDNPYIINSEAAFRAIPELSLTACYEIINDIELTKEFNTFGDFYGKIDGKNHTISSLWSKNYQFGLFKNNYGLIQNLNLKNNNQNFKSDGVFAYKNYGIISNCSFEGLMTGYVDTTTTYEEYRETKTYEGSSYTDTYQFRGLGGVASFNYGIINNSKFKGNLEAEKGNTVGGFIGINIGKIENCLFEGDIYTDDMVGSTGSNTNLVCGFAGYNTTNGIITNCSANTDSIYSRTSSYAGVHVYSFCSNISTIEECSNNYNKLNYSINYTEWGTSGTHGQELSGSGYSEETHKHNYVITKTDPTCTEDGTVVFECIECDYKTDSIATSKLGHDYGEEETVSPTYEEQGYTHKICKRCGYDYKYNYVEAFKIETGSCGTNATYNMDTGKGTLVISGTGAINNYNSGYNSIKKVYRTTAPWGSYDIKSVVIEDGITSIGNYAFFRNEEIEEVSLSSTLQSIGTSAFYGAALSSLELPQGLTTISNSALGGIKNLSEIVIPDSVTDIGKTAFTGCTNLEKATLPCSAVLANSTDDYNDVFYNCNKLKTLYFTKGTGSMPNYETVSPFKSISAKLSEISFAEGVTYIGQNTFKGCSALETVNMPLTKPEIGKDAFKGTPFYKTLFDDKGFLISGNVLMDGTFAEGDVVIPDGITEISDEAFKNNTKITSLTIPESVDKVGSNVLSGCVSLTSLTVPCSLDIYSDGVFDGFTSLQKLTMTKGSGTMVDFSSKYTYTPWYKSSSNISTIIIKDGVTNISPHAFRDLTKLSSIDLADSIRTIGTYAFYQDSLLVSVDLPKNLESIDSFAFCKCSGLKNINTPDTIKSIGLSAFSNCTSLEKFTIPNNIETFGNTVLYNCSSLAELSVPCSLNITANSNNFKNCTNISKISLTKGTGVMRNYYVDTVTYTPWYISRANLDEIILEDGITNIGDYAFYACKGITEINLPDSITSIGERAFDACNTLSSINIPPSVKEIKKWAYRGCTSLTEVVIPETVETLGVGPFINCSGVKTLTLPSDFTMISFGGCTGIETVNVTKGNGIIEGASSNYTYSPWYVSRESVKAINLADGITRIGNYAFYGCTGLVDLKIPQSVTAIGDYAFYNCTGLTKNILTENIESIGMNAFNGCTGLQGIIVIPQKASSIGNYAFRNCSNLTKVFVLNKDCEIYQNSLVFPSTTVIAGYGNSTAQTYATIYSRTFQEIYGKCPECGSYDLSRVIKNANCTEGGYHEYTCENCGHKFTDNHSNPLGHTPAIDEAVAPSCTETGLTAGSHCSVCGEVFVAQEIVSATGHTAVKDDAVAPTCTKTGLTEGSHCSVCGEILKAQEIIPATGHTPVKDEAKAPTCTETGLTEGSHCSVCGEIIKAQEVVPATGHTVVKDEAVAPTCTKTGLTEGSHCSVCKEVLVAQTVIDALGHKIAIDDAVAATCTKTGLTSGAHCSVCGEILVAQEIVPAKGHTVVIDEAKPAICTETGLTEGSHCSVCHEILKAQEIVQATGHTVEKDEAKPATCTETGLTEGSHCSVCHEVLKAQEVVPVKDHEWDDGIITKDPTCTEEGVKTYTCENCKDTKTEKIDALGHTVVKDEAKAATCTETGLTEGSHCSVCHEVLKEQEVISALGHTVVIDEAKPATCTETGLTEGSHCSVCHEVLKEQEVIHALGHTVVKDEAKAATCTETGLTEGSHCSACHEVLKAQEVIHATGHKWDEGKVTKEPTCTEDGVKTFTCENCKETKTEKIDALGHTVVKDEAKPATCTETGLTEGSHCSVCHEVLKEQEVIPAKGHKWDEGKVTKEPTCTEEGVKTFECENCDETKTEAIEAKGHSWDEGVVTKEPTYKEEGEKLYTCTVCKATKTEKIPTLEKKGKLVVSNETVRAGDDVQVKIYIDKNPGITAMSINVAFPDELKLKDVKYTNLLSSKPSNSKEYTSPFVISWLSSDSSDKDDTGLFATLTFTADIDAEVTDYTVRATYKTNNIVDSTLDTIPFDVDNGTVSVQRPTPGDVNRDGAINMKDLVLIQQLINNWDIHIVERAADVNDDGDINMKDLVILQQYINGWEVVLK